MEKNQQVIAQYDYDGDGQRIKKTEWVESLQDYQTLIHICSQTGVIYEKNVATGQEATYVYGPTGRIAKNVSGLIDYYHTDCLGSTRLITNESGNTVTDVTYTPFGEITLNGEEDHYLYTGKEKDSTDLYYFGARYYDPQIGRFITRDPLKGKTEYPQTLNLYAYCLNNPLKYIDSHGMDCVFVILPDGTISYELADIMNRLQDALGKLDWDDVQSDLDDGDLVAALKTILETVFPDSEIIAGEDIITVKLNGGYVLGFIWSDSSDERLNPHRWGFTEQLGPFGANIYLNKDLIKDAGDLFCVLSHELTHAYLHREFTSIDLSEMSGGDKRGFQEAVAYTIEWRIMSQINDDYLTENFKSHVNKEYAWAFLYYKLGPSYDK